MIKIIVFVFTVFLLALFVSSIDADRSTKTNSVEVGEEEQVEGSGAEQESSQSGSVLDLSGRNLDQVPSYVFQNTNLVELDLSNNDLQGSLQAEVRNLQDLKILDLSDNDFTGVPAEVGQLTQLEVLDLSNNSITGLPYELGDLSNLQILDLRGTQYAPQDLEIIKQKLGSGVLIYVD